eukprot:1166992-Alexandrium_andersonii.AAC.1
MSAGRSSTRPATVSSTTSTNRSSVGRAKWPRSSPCRAVRAGARSRSSSAVSYTHLRAHETSAHL